MTINDYHSYDFLNNYCSAKDIYDSHVYLVKFIDKMIRLTFQTTNESFHMMGQVKKLKLSTNTHVAESKT